MPTPTQDLKKRISLRHAFAAGDVSDKGFDGVTIITADVEALGHGFLIDQKTVDGLYGLVQGKKIPSYLTHDGVDEGEDRLGEEIGLFSKFVQDGPKLKADFRFLRSFVKNEADEHEQLVELAQEIPDQFGVSVVCDCDAVWVCDDESETDAWYPKPENCSAQMPTLRFTRIESADFVKNPAANPDGVFNAKVDEKAGGMAETTVTLAKHTEALAAKDAELKALSDSHKAALDKAQADHVAVLAEKETAHAAALEALKGEGAKALAALKAEHATVVAGLSAQIKQAELFDCRKIGVPEAAVLAAKITADQEPVLDLPEPAESDADRWVQFTELQAKSAKTAAAFRAKYLGANRTK